MLRFYPVKIHRSLPLTAAMLSLLALTVAGTVTPASAQATVAAKQQQPTVVRPDAVPAKVAAQLSAVKTFLKSLPATNGTLRGD